MHDAARRARAAARELDTLTTTVKDRALHTAADAVLGAVDAILAANAEDLDAARAAGTPDAMLDRLALNPQRVDGIAAGLRQVAGLPDPIGEVLRGRTLPNGLQVGAIVAVNAVGDIIDHAAFAEAQRAKAEAEAKRKGCDVIIYDTAGRLAIDEKLMQELMEQFKELDAVIFAVSHKNYLDMGVENLTAMVRDGGIFMDVKSAFSPAIATRPRCRHPTSLLGW